MAKNYTTPTMPVTQANGATLETQLCKHSWQVIDDGQHVRRMVDTWNE
jgi:hypothetical protein